MTDTQHLINQIDALLGSGGVSGGDDAVSMDAMRWAPEPPDTVTVIRPEPSWHRVEQCEVVHGYRYVLPGERLAAVGGMRGLLRLVREGARRDAVSRGVPMPPDGTEVQVTEDLAADELQCEMHWGWPPATPNIGPRRPRPRVRTDERRIVSARVEVELEDGERMTVELSGPEMLVEESYDPGVQEGWGSWRPVIRDPAATFTFRHVEHMNTRYRCPEGSPGAQALRQWATPAEDVTEVTPPE